MRALARFVLVAVLTAGCAGPVAVNVVRNPQFNYSATDAKAVAIHSSPPAAEYEVIGEVRTRVSAGVPMDQVEASLKEEGARIGANAVVIVVKDVVTEQKIQRPAAGSQQPIIGSQQAIGTAGTPRGGGVATLPTQTGRTEEVTIRVHEKEITGVVIRFKKK